MTAAVLFAFSRAILPILLLWVWWATDPPVTTPVLAVAVFLGGALPALAAALVGRAHRGRVACDGKEILLQGGGTRLEIPAVAIERVVPWTVPLPGPGFGFRMRSGHSLRYGVQAADPTPILTQLSPVVASAADAIHHPTVRYARAKQDCTPRRWYHPVGKFVVFALLPTAILFNAHQYIAYGGTLGEYYLLGLRAYLATFGLYWLTMVIYLVLYASVWRGMAEGVALASAWLAPLHAARVRRIVEIGCAIGYYAGVPLLIAVRFLA